MKIRASAAFACLSLALLFAGPSLAAATIDTLKLEDGRDENNKIGVPVFDASGVGSLRIGAIAAAYDKKAKIVRRTGRKFPPAAAGPEYDLSPTIDLASLLTDTLLSEAPALGFKLTAGDDFGWDVKGTLKDIYLESRQVYMGATLFFGYMDVEFQVRKAGAEPKTERLRAHKYFVAFNAGMGRKDEAREGLAHLLIEGGQEMLARLNREHFKAPAHPGIEKKIAGLTGTSRNDLHLVGLSGSPAAVAPVSALILKTQDENDRAVVVDAAGRLGAPQLISVLASRYATEDEDVRWATLKAIDSIGAGSAEARAVLEKASKDEHDPCKRLAARILSSPRP